ncbi:MAG: ScyD/ScyE family protein [Gaiella sp.]
MQRSLSLSPGHRGPVAVGLVGALAAACLAALVAPATSAPRITTVMSGLNSPRGLGFAPTGDLVVVEAGDGAGSCADGVNTLALPPRNAPICVGSSGSISVVAAGGAEQQRTQTGWPSWRSNAPNQPFAEVTGPQDIDFPTKGRAFVTIGWGGTPAARTAAAAKGRAFGRLVQTGPNGKRRTAADIAGYEQAFNPAGGPVDSNPYGVLAEPGAVYVTDAGANALYRVKGWNVSLVAAFPPAQRTCTTPFPAPPVQESVPTTVVRGPDKALYVGELTGFPFCAGVARIWRIADGEAPTVYLSGFKMIMDMAFAKDGSLYVLQYASSPFVIGGPGQIVRVAPGGTRTVLETGGALQQPAGLEIGDDGALYVSNKTVTPGGGEVLRILP